MLKPADITSFEAFEQVPVVTKAEMRESQANHPPFGDYLCCDESEIHHIHGTSGTTGAPTAFAIGRRDWEVIADNHARILWGMGVRPGDTVFVAALFSLYLGSWGALAGAERLHCRVLPFGAGAQGMTARAVTWLARTKPKAFYATPSYALRLAEVAEQEGIDPREFGLQVMFFSGEPGASVPAVREAIEDAFGATVIDCGTMAEMTPFMSASATAGTPDGMLLWQDIVWHEVCDPETFRTVPYGSEGTPVYTHLERTSQPMIRLASNDLTRWVMEDNPCGRTYPKLPEGVYGRIDDMIHIRGENVYPTEVDNYLRGVSGYGGEHQIVVRRTGSMDEMIVRAETTHPAGQRDAFERDTGAGLQSLLGVRVTFESVDARHPRARRAQVPARRRRTRAHEALTHVSGIHGYSREFRSRATKGVIRGRRPGREAGTVRRAGDDRDAGGGGRLLRDRPPAPGRAAGPDPVQRPAGRRHRRGRRHDHPAAPGLADGERGRPRDVRRPLRHAVSGYRNKHFPFATEDEFKAGLDQLGQAFVDGVRRPTGRPRSPRWRRLRTRCSSSCGRSSTTATTRARSSRWRSTANLPAGRDYHGPPLPYGYLQTTEPWDEELLTQAQENGSYLETDEVVRVDLSQLSWTK